MMPLPSRTEVVQVIDRLLSGSIQREVVAKWASERHVHTAADSVVEEALDIMALIDARHVSDVGQPLEYMYDFAEILAARVELLNDTDD